MNELFNEAKKRFLGTFLDDVLGYWRLYDRLKIRFESAFGEGSVQVGCENDFWYSVLGDRYSGSHVSKYVPLRFRNFLEEHGPSMARETA